CTAWALRSASVLSFPAAASPGSAGVTAYALNGSPVVSSSRWPSLVYSGWQRIRLTGLDHAQLRTCGSHSRAHGASAAPGAPPEVAGFRTCAGDGIRTRVLPGGGATVPGAPTTAPRQQKKENPTRR